MTTDEADRKAILKKTEWLRVSLFGFGVVGGIALQWLARSRGVDRLGPIPRDALLPISTITGGYLAYCVWERSNRARAVVFVFLAFVAFATCIFFWSSQAP